MAISTYTQSSADKVKELVKDAVRAKQLDIEDAKLLGAISVCMKGAGWNSATLGAIAYELGRPPEYVMFNLGQLFGEWIAFHLDIETDDEGVRQVLLSEIFIGPIQKTLDSAGGNGYVTGIEEDIKP